MRTPDVAYIQWAKALPRARVNLARSGAPPCPASELHLTAADLQTNIPTHDGYGPLLDAYARRYRVARDEVYPVSGGTSFANWLVFAAALAEATRSTEVIVETPGYEPLIRIPEAFGVRMRRVPRRARDGWAIDLDRFRALVTPQTRLAVVSDLHNPTGARLEPGAIAAMAAALARVGGLLLVDEVYLECLFGPRTASSVHLGDNVVVTNSLTKAYGLDGLRAGVILGPAAFVAKAARANDLLANHNVAAGDLMALAALRHLPAIRRRAQAVLAPNLDRVRRFLAGEPRLRAEIPPGGTIVFPALPRGLDGDTFAAHLLERYDTLVVPGRFFEAPNHVRISFCLDARALDRGLRNISRALDDLAPSAP
ncbi:MAG: aminotransferase class I/II-fold pyridoxal phosphate-dependent enzyme [Vicinamibacterales bacterium]